MQSWRRSAWSLSLSLVIVSGCKSDVDQPAADPLDDPWVNAIDTGDEEPVVAASEPVGAGTQSPPPTVAQAGSRPAAQVVATPFKDDAESIATARSKPATVPEPPTDDAPAVDEQPEQPAPTPVAEPTSVPTAEPAKPASPPPITSADFHGSYRYAGGNAQREDLEAAIEATVTQLAKAIQGIARKRLTQANPVDSSVEIVVAGDEITTTFESGFHVTCVIDGATVKTTGIDGEKLAVRVRSKGSKLVQHMQGKDGARTIVYVLSADRNKLTVHHKITADRLPEPLTYQLSYSRK